MESQKIRAQKMAKARQGEPAGEATKVMAAQTQKIPIMQDLEYEGRAEED